MKNQNITIKTETVAAVKARQVIWLGWMKKAVAELNDDSLVEVTTHHAPFGDYCLDIKKAPAPTA